MIFIQSCASNLLYTRCETLTGLHIVMLAVARHSIMSNTSMSSLAAVVQMTVTNDVTHNLSRAAVLVSQASARGADMVFLPEACDYIGESRDQTLALAQPITGDTVGQFKKMAVQHGVWLSLGGVHTITEGEKEKTSNTHIIINKEGEMMQTYNKAHLFDVNITGGAIMSESAYVTPGSSLPSPVPSPLGRVGLGICYDLRFPEISQALASAGAELLTYPSAFTVTTGQAHWEALLRARAIETQCYVVAAAQSGKHGAKRSSYGHSMIVDPWGVVVAQCGEGEGVAVANIDLGYLSNIRKNMPVQHQRRPDLYGRVGIRGQGPVELPGEKFVFNFGPAKVPGLSIFYRTELTVAFNNKKPVVEGHFLVSPVRMVEKLGDLTEEELTDLFKVVQKVEMFSQKFYKVGSTTISIQNGPLAGQSIPHVHVHILPRREGDFAENDDIYKELQEHDKVKTGWRTEEEMVAEAKVLREAWGKVN